MRAIWSLSASQVACLIQQKKLSAMEVAKAALARMEEVNPRINAVIDCRQEEVLARADSIDKALAEGIKLGPLAGVPVTVKVNIDQLGYATTNGVKLQKDLIANSNSPVVDSLLKAGANIIGRTNTPAFSYRWFTNNLLHGHTYNARNKLLTPGGSSGGAASAVAAGIGCIAHGTDIAGSIRYPAYACGVHGLRPSLGRIAAYNASSAERSIGGQLMAVSGPIARTIEDLRMGLAAMAQADDRDPWYVEVPLVSGAMPKIAAVCYYPEGLKTDPLIVKALQESVVKLKEAGWVVDEVENLPPMREACDVQITLWMGDGYEKLLKLAEQEGDEGAITALKGQEAFARSVTLQSFSEALTRRAALTRDWQLFMARYAVLLLPVSGELPFADDLDLQGEEAYKRVWEAQLPMISLPVTGLPSLAMTTNILEDNTPVGIQIVAGRFREDLCLQAAEAIEQRSEILGLAEFNL